MTGPSGLADALASRLRALWGTEVQVTGVRLVPGGASRESRHHRRYRITEGTEEIQMRRVAGYLFGFIKPGTLKGVTG